MELGGDLNLTDNIQARATWFRRNQNGLIDWTVTPYANMPRQINLSPTGTYALASNIASVTTRGMELDLEGHHRFKKGTQLTWRSGLTLLRSLTPQSTSPSFYLSSHAKTIWNTSFSFSGKRGAISLATNYKLRNTLNAPNINAKISPNYFITSIRAEKYFLKGRLAVQLQADNLFNTSYSDLLGSVMPGRWIQVGGRIGLDRKKD
jgi:iron complex outermembrane receptor protein